MEYDVVLQLTVELTTASSYLGQGAGLKMLILVIFLVMITLHLVPDKAGLLAQLSAVRPHHIPCLTMF